MIVDRLVGMISLGDIAARTGSERPLGEVVAQISASVSSDEVYGTPQVGTTDRVQESIGGSG